MKRFAVQLHERTIIDWNTGLKETALTPLLDLYSVRGRLLAIYCIDPDDLAQNERIQIQIDDAIVFDDAAIDIPNTDYFLHLLGSLAKGTAIGGTATAADLGHTLDDKNGLPFQYRLVIRYLRAAAGTTGLTINIVVAAEADVANI